MCEMWCLHVGTAGLNCMLEGSFINHMKTQQ